MKKRVSIIGGGAAALMCACQLDTSKFDVTIYEKNKALGRKFLVAGKGGFNLTHSEGLETFIKRYTPKSFLSDAIRIFTNQDLRNELSAIGVSTFVGSSKRVYPEKGIKPIEVLKAFESKLEAKGVQVKCNRNWIGWNDNGSLNFEGEKEVQSDMVIYALGGGSWKVTGSDGGWSNVFRDKGIGVQPFLSSNCNFKVDWNTQIISKIEGQPLKNIATSINGKSQKGEAIITRNGIEGNAIYALSPLIRRRLTEDGVAKVSIDFKPQLEMQKVISKLKEEPSPKITEKLKLALKLSKAQLELIKSVTSKEEFNDLAYLARLIKHFPIEVIGLAPVDEAISTVGGIALSEVNTDFELYEIPNHYVIGEMLDWDAPTGGYLLQGCFSMGASVARKLNSKY